MLPPRPFSRSTNCLAFIGQRSDPLLAFFFLGVTVAMSGVDALKKIIEAQAQAQLALGAAIEELAVWVESNGGGQAASNARDALKALDVASVVIADSLSEISDDSDGTIAASSVP